MNIAKTVSNSKLVSEDSPILAQIIVDAAGQVADTFNGDTKIEGCEGITKY